MISISLFLGIIGVFLFAGCMRSLTYDKEDFPQYKAKEWIDDSGIADPSLMNYQFLDMGVNMAAGLFPKNRFFCGFNLPLDEIQKEQDACLESGCVDFVMTFVMEINSPNYEKVGQYDAIYHLGDFYPHYNLYQRIETQPAE